MASTKAAHEKASHTKESQTKTAGKASSGKASAGKTSTAKKSAGKTSGAKSGHAKEAEHESHGSQTTTDHEEIRRWAEDRNAVPSCVKGTGTKKDAGVLRLNFPGYAEEGLEEISWDEFFEKFDHNKLALLYQEETAAGKKSNFNKLISRPGK